jgi:hypothetical protein
MINKNPPLCAYCGENPATTDDHVVPRCFFAEKHRNNTIVNIIVPACDECNKKFSLDEEYVLSVIVPSLECGEHPEAKELLEEDSPIMRGFKRGRGPLPRILSNSEPIFIMMHSLLLPTLKMKVDTARFNNVMDKIVKGLYFHIKKERFPDNLNNDIFIVPIDVAIKSLNGKLKTHGQVLGNDVFRFYCLMAGDPPIMMVWLMSFYAGLCVACVSLEEQNATFMKQLNKSRIYGLEDIV